MNIPPIRRGRGALCGVLLATTLAGCVLGPDARTPKVDVPAQWSRTNAADAPQADPTLLAQWWKRFGDPELDALVERTLAGNLDLQSANARIAQSRAQLEAQTAGLFPSLSAKGDYKRYKIPDAIKEQFGDAAGQQGQQGGAGGGFSIPGYINTYQLGFDASWQLDLWGGTRRGIQSAQASLAAAVWARRAAVVATLAELGSDYATLRATQARLALAERNAAIAAQSLDLTRSLARNGLASGIDLAQSEGNLETVRATLPPLRAGVAQSKHAIAILVGALPESLDEELDGSSGELRAPPPIPAGLPSQLLAARPDIREADYQYAAATAQVGVAVAQRLPNLSLTGSAGYATNELDKLLRAGAFTWSLGASITAPLFDAGKLEANQRAAEAAATQQEIAYRKTVLQAFGEVEDGLTNVQSDAERDTALNRAVAANRRAYDQSTSQFRHGQASYLQVLQSEQSLNANTDQQLQARQQQVRDLIAVYKALGGGWQAGEGEPAVQAATAAPP